MKNILISGLINLETTVRVRRFPVDYYPIDFPFFGVNTAVSGVAYNVALALHTLNDRVKLLSMTGDDFAGSYIRAELQKEGLGVDGICNALQQTPESVILYDGDGRRQIHCDLKNIQESNYAFDTALLNGIDLVAACNINFNRPLLSMAKAAGKAIATDVHVLSDLYDDYSREFMEYADILFLSDEGIGEDYRGFLSELARIYGNEVIVLGRGGKGAAMYLKSANEIYELPAAQVGEVINTVGAGDALFSAFLHYYANGFSPLECLSRAQLFAAAKIRVSGASKGFMTEEEIEVLYACNQTT